MEWNDPKINWYLTEPSFYHSSNNNPILSEMDQRFLHRKKKNLTRSQRYLSKWYYSSCNDSILPTCKIKITESHDSTQLFRHKEKTQRLLFQSYKIIPRGNDLDITLGNRIKTRHPTNSFPSKDSLNKNSVHSSTFLIPTSYLYTSASSCFYPWPQIRQTQENNARRSGALPPDPPGIAFITFLPGTRLCRRLLRITTTLSSRLIRHPRVREFTARIVNAQRGSMDSIRVLYLLHKCLKSLRGLLVLIIIRSMVYKESI